MMMKTFSIKKSEIKRSWYLIDAKRKILGRIATQAAIVLRGKHKKEFTSNQNMGDFVVIINSDHLKTTGKKLEQKMYIRHTGYPGGVKEKTLGQQMQEDSRLVLKKAITGMIPANRLKKEQIKRLKIYKGEVHKHTQNMKELGIRN